MQANDVENTYAPMLTASVQTSRKVVYVISDLFPYEKIICDDAGPNYAARQGWKVTTLEGAENIAADILVIDNRLAASELATANELVQRQAGRLIYFKVVDLIWRSLEQPYYQLLFKLARLANVRFLLPYAPAKLTKMLCEVTGREDNYVVVPYAYDKRREIAIDGRRNNRLVATGALGEIYPLRWRIYLARRRRLRIRSKVSYLRHPNYPDLGQRVAHEIVGDRFIEYLAKFRFMLVTCAEDGEEFLKYSECGYAGCVPVGEVPKTFSERLASCVFRIDSGTELLGQLSRLLRMPDDEWSHITEEYRFALARERHPEILQQSLLSNYENWLGGRGV